MKLIAQKNLEELKSLIRNLDDAAYIAQPKILFGASIGQHIRHILEFYLLLVSGSFLGTICYDKRERNLSIERDSGEAIKIIDKLLLGLETLDLEQPVDFEGDFSEDEQLMAQQPSSIGRELVYCIEHSIHHQALIKAALIALGLDDLAETNFGVAYSTIKYRKDKCAQ